METKIDEIEDSLTENEIKPQNLERFISLIRRYKALGEVSDMMLAELIDKILVNEAEGIGKARTQRVDIYFHYVGQINIELSTEEGA